MSSMKTCATCETKLVGRQKKYCSNRCQIIERDKELDRKFENGTFDGASETVRRYVLRTRPSKCEGCGGEEWLGNPMPLEVHHEDGNRKNNHPNNLKLLCLNCHWFTDTFRVKNRKALKE